jgi:hypothetical protein
MIFTKLKNCGKPEFDSCIVHFMALGKRGIGVEVGLNIEHRTFNIE